MRAMIDGLPSPVKQIRRTAQAQSSARSGAVFLLVLFRTRTRNTSSQERIVDPRRSLGWASNTNVLCICYGVAKRYVFSFLKWAARTCGLGAVVGVATDMSLQGGCVSMSPSHFDRMVRANELCNQRPRAQNENILLNRCL